ncbi:MAG: PrsW family intramembrane metalloprotease, partial [Cyanobacteria bacterium SZAS TMP-1]|nr:PrsW family intramembrane metalloprotease [Cyanobacteria bacterium SZAS TMP-1]
MTQKQVQIQPGEGTTTWGSLPIGDSNVQVRHLVLWLGIIAWLLPIFFYTEVQGIAWFSFNIAFLIILLLATSFVRSISLHKMAVCFFGGGLVAGLVLAIALPVTNFFTVSNSLRFLFLVPLEELFKLLPIALLLWRGRKFSTWTLGATDFLLMGAAAGAGFAIAEDSFIHFQLHSPLNNLSLLMPASEISNGRIICGHAVWTALAAGSIGMAAMYRHQKKVALPFLFAGLALAILDHLALNLGASLSVINILLVNGYVTIAVFAATLLASILVDSSVALKNLPPAREFKFPRRKDRKEPLSALWDCIIDLRRLNYAYYRYRHYLDGEVPAALAVTVAILAKRLVNRYLAAEPVAGSLATAEKAAIAPATTPATAPAVNQASSFTNNKAIPAVTDSSFSTLVVPGANAMQVSGQNPPLPAYNAKMEVSAGGLSPFDKRPFKEQIDLPERYKLQEEAFRGGMGIIFKGRHKQTRAALAIKVLHPHLADNTSYLLRFEQEAKAASQLKHPNIVTV